MGNCLVTKLKSSVEDKSLKYFDSIRFFVDWSTNSSKELVLESVSEGTDFGGEGVIVKVLSNGYIESNGQNKGLEYVSTNGKVKHVIKPNSVDAVTEFLLIGLSGISGAHSNNSYSSVTTLDSDSLKYCNLKATSNFIVYSAPSGYDATDISYVKDSKNKASVTSIRFNQATKNVKGDIIALSGFNNVTIITGLAGKNDIVGDVSAFANMKGLTSLDFFSTGISGNIASLGALPNLSSIVCYSSKVGGTLEGLIAAFIANGRTSGELSRINMYGTSVTYKGSPLDGNKKVTWDGSGNITLTSL